MGIILLGGGGHALVVAEAIAATGGEVAGFLDDDASAVLGHASVRLGGLEDAPRVLAGVSGWIAALGSLERRRDLLALLVGRGVEARATSVVHPAAMVSTTAVIARGVFVGARAVVQARARLGAHAIVNTGAIVEHECEVGTNAHVAPGAILAGRCRVGAGTLIGLGARVLPGLSIGPGCVVGAGATVTRDVEDGATVVGTPARRTSAASAAAVAN